MARNGKKKKVRMVGRTINMLPSKWAQIDELSLRGANEYVRQAVEEKIERDTKGATT